MTNVTEDNPEYSQKWRLHSPKNLRRHLSQAVHEFRQQDPETITYEYWRVLAMLLRLQLDILRAEKDSELLERLEDLERQVAKMRGLRVA